MFTEAVEAFEEGFTGNEDIAATNQKSHQGEKQMKNLELLKVSGLLGEKEDKAIKALNEQQRTDVKSELDYVVRVITGLEDGEPTPSGCCSCGTCYKSDQKKRDAITALATVIDEYGYEVVRWHARFFDSDDIILSLLLTIYLNVPEIAEVQASVKAAL